MPEIARFYGIVIRIFFGAATLPRRLRRTLRKDRYHDTGRIRRPTAGTCISTRDGMGSTPSGRIARSIQPSRQHATAGKD
jgi:hypothetical protein